MPLNTSAHMASYDALYEAILDAHQGLSIDDSQALNARLVLLLANHVGDLEVLREALQAARAGWPSAESGPMGMREGPAQAAAAGQPVQATIAATRNQDQ